MNSVIPDVERLVLPGMGFGFKMYDKSWHDSNSRARHVGLINPPHRHPR
jgi:hypothetical protein